MKRIVASVALLAVLLLAGTWWFAVSRTQPSLAREGAAATAREGGAAKSAGRSEVIALPSLTGGAPLRVPTPAAAPAAVAPLNEQIRDSRDLRGLYERTKDLPDPRGERAYRFADAIFECGAFVDVPFDELSRRLAVGKGAANNPRRQEMLGAMFERCRGFSGNPAALSQIIQSLHRQAEAAGYPAEVARSLRFEAPDRDPARADEIAMGLLASNPDADVVHEVAQYLNQRNRASAPGTDAGTRAIAWGLLECDYGADCGPRSRPVAMTCIVLGVCDLQNVEEAVVAEGSQAVLNAANAMRRSLARQIAERDWSGVGFTRSRP